MQRTFFQTIPIFIFPALQAFPVQDAVEDALDIPDHDEDYELKLPDGWPNVEQVELFS
jgi:hypothetical protein